MSEEVKLAFPVVIDDASKNQFFDVGMSLRDYFAAKALVGMAANDYWALNLNGEPKSMDAVANVAYQMADAMMKARQ